MDGKEAKVLAVLGKGGAGKTVFSALAARALKDMDAGPLLLIDADPTGGLSFAVGADTGRSMGQVREALIRKAGRTDPDELARRVDWMALEALQELDGFSLLSMGRTEGRGCFCSVNKLLREAIGTLIKGYAIVVLDAEAGIEQVNRQVIRRVDFPVVVTDGSVRGFNAARQVGELLVRYGFGSGGGLVLNRADGPAANTPEGLSFLGTVPGDEQVQKFDMEGRSLMGLPDDSPALRAVRGIVEQHVLST